MGNIQTVGPNEALIVSGGCFGSTGKKMVVGGWAWAWSLLTDVQRLSLEIMSLRPVCERVETAEGVALTVTGVAQVKIMKEDEYLSMAAEQFLGKEPDQIKVVILQTLEGHLRAILGTLTVEEVYRDRDQFASLVREIAAPDIRRMGIEIMSFTIKDLFDEVGYLSSLGKARTAAVQRDADIGVAQAERDAGIMEAECEKDSLNVKFATQSKVENSQRMYHLEKAKFDTEVNAQKAEAQLAYELQSTVLSQNIRQAELEIDVIERRKEIELQNKENERYEKELEANIKMPADAEAYSIETLAEGRRKAKLGESVAIAEKIKLRGEAEAIVLEAIGKAQADGMRLKADVYQAFGEAATLSIVLDVLPQLAAHITSPLAKTDEIVLLSGTDSGGMTTQLASFAAKFPTALEAITGLDIKSAFKSLATKT